MKNEKVSVPSLLLMIILVAFPQISETIYTPSLPDISKALHVSNNEVQLTLSVYFAGFALGVFLLDGYRILLAVARQCYLELSYMALEVSYALLQIPLKFY